MVANRRRLIYIPILHTQHDMGSLQAGARRAFLSKLGEDLWRHHVRAIDAMWTGIGRRLTQLRLHFQFVHLYQDGLPVCGKEQQIVEELAAQGSPNHQLLLRLMLRGATLMGTEDPHLLVKEYQYLKRILSLGANGKDAERRAHLVKEYEQAAPELLAARDRFIRDRIVQTLPRGGTGLLLIGLLHRVDELLPADIQVSYLIHRLPFWRSFEMEVVA